VFCIISVQTKAESVSSDHVRSSDTGNIQYRSIFIDVPFILIDFLS